MYFLLKNFTIFIKQLANTLIINYLSYKLFKYLQINSEINYIKINQPFNSYLINSLHF